jgi:hypothetical protein
MFCPECRAEYRPGFIRCADCDVDLVQELPVELSGTGKTLQRSWRGRTERPTRDFIEGFRTKSLTKSGLTFNLHQFTGMFGIPYWIRSALVFVMHQIIGTEGVAWLSTLGVSLLRSSVREIHKPWGDSALMRGMHLIFSNTPFFPIQIAVGACFGWKLYRRWGHRSMLWVWILPGMVLTYAVIAIPTFSPWSSSPADTGPLSHYFGWGCQADNRCYDQMTFTMPFYISVAYSLGALWASRRLRSSRYVMARQP